jgi:hypothetical protein
MLCIVFCGTLPELNFYDSKALCLHTADEDYISTIDVDMYQFALLALLWVVAVHSPSWYGWHERQHEG